MCVDEWGGGRGGGGSKFRGEREGGFKVVCGGRGGVQAVAVGRVEKPDEAKEADGLGLPWGRSVRGRDARGKRADRYRQLAKALIRRVTLGIYDSTLLDAGLSARSSSSRERRKKGETYQTSSTSSNTLPNDMMSPATHQAAMKIA